MECQDAKIKMMPHECLKCKESPQKGNNKQPCLITCIKHAMILQQNGCDIDLVNKFCLYHELKTTLNGVKRNSQLNESKRNSKIIKLESRLKRFKQDETQKIERVTNRILQGKLRRSKRQLTKTKANINESIQYLNDEEDLSVLETMCGEKNVHSYLLNNPELSTLIENERYSEDTWNSLTGCRKGRHVIDTENDSLYHHTGGVQSWMTQSNFIISLSENVHRETPTEVIAHFSCLMTSTDAHTQFASRIIGLG